MRLLYTLILMMVAVTSANTSRAETLESKTYSYGLLRPGNGMADATESDLRTKASRMCANRGGTNSFEMLSNKESNGSLHHYGKGIAWAECTDATNTAKRTYLAPFPKAVDLKTLERIVQNASVCEFETQGGEIYVQGYDARISRLYLQTTCDDRLFETTLPYQTTDQIYRQIHAMTELFTFRGADPGSKKGQLAMKNTYVECDDRDEMGRLAQAQAGFTHQPLRQTGFACQASLLRTR